jgi:hypothetical protein
MSRSLAVALAAMALAALTIAHPDAQQQASAFPATPPKPGPAKNFEVPSPARMTLDNGLEVELVQWGTIPKAFVALSVRSGNVFEQKDQIWLADLTGRLMREPNAPPSSASITSKGM